jgi:hypothetical protein
MAAYPSFKQLVPGTKLVPLDDLAIDRAENGDIKSQALFTSVRYVGELVHILDKTDFATLKSFYSTNRLNQNTFTWVYDGASYTFFFNGHYQFEPITPKWVRVTVPIAVV